MKGLKVKKYQRILKEVRLYKLLHMNCYKCIKLELIFHVHLFNTYYLEEKI